MQEIDSTLGPLRVFIYLFNEIQLIECVWDFCLYYFKLLECSSCNRKYPWTSAHISIYSTIVQVIDITWDICIYFICQEGVV